MGRWDSLARVALLGGFIVAAVLLAPGSAPPQTPAATDQATFELEFLTNLIIFNEVLTADQQRTILDELTLDDQIVLTRGLYMLDFLMVLQNFRTDEQEAALESVPEDERWAMMGFLLLLPQAQATVQQQQAAKKAASG